MPVLEPERILNAIQMQMLKGRLNTNGVNCTGYVVLKLQNIARNDKHNSQRDRNSYTLRSFIAYYVIVRLAE